MGKNSNNVTNKMMSVLITSYWESGGKNLIYLLFSSDWGIINRRHTTTFVNKKV